MPRADVAILTVIPAELNAAQEALRLEAPQRDVDEDLTRYWLGSVHSRCLRRKLTVSLGCIGKPGNSAAATAAIAMASRYQPGIMILMGIGAGIRGKVKIGDVVLGSHIVSYESAVQVVTNEGLPDVERRPEIVELQHAVLQDVTSYLSDRTRSTRLEKIAADIGITIPEPPSGEEESFRLHVLHTVSSGRLAAIASGEKLLRDPSILKTLREEVHGKTEVGEMEAAGFVSACSRKRLPWLVIRGVSDFGDDLKDDRFHTFASSSAAIVLADFIGNSLELDFTTHSPQELGDETVSAQAEIELDHLLAEYKRATHAQHQMLRSVIFSNKSQRLSDIYVPLTVADAKSKTKIKVDKFPRDLFARQRKYVIENTAGAGKSTLMAHIVCTAIDEESVTPILVHLRRISDKNSLFSEIEGQLASLRKQPSPDSLRTRIIDGGFLFLFDGFDEVADEHRAFVIEEICSLVSKAGTNCFIVTSRPDPILNNFLDFERLKILPLEFEESLQVIRRYGAIIEGDASERLIEDVRKDKRTTASEFLSNPLLVSLMLLTYAHTPSIPERSVDFYERVYQALYEGHDLLKGGYRRKKRSTLAKNELLQVLRTFALMSVASDQLEYSEIDIDAILTRAIIHSSFQATPQDVLHDLTQSVPLLTKDGRYYTWCHRSMREYFAASFLYTYSDDRQLRKLYASPNMRRYRGTLAILSDLDHARMRQTMLYWFLSDYLKFRSEGTTWPGRDEIHTAIWRGIEFEMSGFGCCVYTTEFLNEISPEGPAIEESFYTKASKHTAILDEKVAILSALHNSGGTSHPGKSYYSIFKSGQWTPQLFTIVFGVFDALKQETKYGHLYAGRFRKHPYLDISPASDVASILVPNTWYLNCGDAIAPDGSVTSFREDAEVVKAVISLMCSHRRLLIPDEVQELHRQLELEIEENNRNRKDIEDILG